MLVVDDDPGITRSIRRLVEPHVGQVLLAESAAEAWEHVRDGLPDVVISDIVLGEDDGLTLLEELQRVAPTARLVAMSGYSPDPERLRALQRRRVPFLAKPFGRHELLQAVTDIPDPAPALPVSGSPG